MAQSTLPPLDIATLPWWGVEVFRAHGMVYTWQDVLMSARLRGDWDAIDTGAREGLACASEAARTGSIASKARIEEAAREFRYAHDLITAASADRWLTRWGLEVEQWLGHFTRLILRRDSTDSAFELAARNPPSREAVADAAIVDAICGGNLRRLARVLAEHIAAPAPSSGLPASESDSASRVEAAANAARTDRWPEMSSDRLASLAEAHHRYRAFGLSAVTPSSLAEHVGTRQLDWTRFEVRSLGFPSADGASEAVLCLREDGLALDELARQAGSTVRETSFFLEEIDSAVHDRFVGARPGDLIGPVRLDGEYLLYEIAGKTLPSPADPVVRVRAQEGVLKRAIAHQVANHVQWSAEP